MLSEIRFVLNGLVTHFDHPAQDGWLLGVMRIWAQDTLKLELVLIGTEKNTYSRSLVLRTSGKDPDSESRIISYGKSSSWIKNPIFLQLKPKDPRPLSKKEAGPCSAPAAISSPR